ncbi:hypothetical protein RYX36_022970, partial [Vicia faba]
VIGLVSEIGYTQLQRGSKKQQINLVLRDLSNNCLNCTLWEGYTMQFNYYNKDRKDSSIPTVMVLHFSKNLTIDFGGIFNSIFDFINTSSTQASGSSHITFYDKLMYKAIVLHLPEIMKLQANASQPNVTPNVTQTNESVDEAMSVEDWAIIPDVEITSNSLSEPITSTSISKRIALQCSNELTEETNQIGEATTS